ncbi:MAG: hypothetical protein EA378_08215 [Phycisphaerales bacterium]|nr:MAG: hypothetical protein EA378_08215 [Phycisphaerales bacterium]
MLTSRRARAMRAFVRLALGGPLLGAALLIVACASRPAPLEPPAPTIAPYDTVRGEPLWAVVPLRNETGVSFVDSYAISDRVVAAAAQVRGVRALPLNRTIAQMRALGMHALESPDDARRLATELGADAIIVGSITSYDPYKPALGLALALYPTPRGRIEDPRHVDLDPRQLIYQPTEYTYFPEHREPRDEPGSVVSEHLDGENHQVIYDVRGYAQGRQDPEQRVLGWRRYLASMELFTEFAAHHTVAQLIRQEWLRTERMAREDDRRPRR